MEKVQLQVIGLSASPTTNNAYALILKELDGDRRLPIIIGAFEAQSIALEMEGLTPPRPMTHDLVKNIFEQFGAILSEVYINDLVDGTFYAKLIFDNVKMEVDSRPSDAVALAVRCQAPIFVNSDILDDTGLLPQPEEDIPESEESDFGSGYPGRHEEAHQTSKPRTRVEQLQIQLEKAIKEEDYELAAKLRDELKKILESS